jgi:hypothetical protein
LNRSQTGGYVLKFISGKYQGGEFPLELDTEIEIGRGGELDMVLVEDMVSRRHARITTYGGELFIEDFKSTNGTFVNGEKIESKSRIKEGDRILIGTNIIKLVHRDRNVEDTGPEFHTPGGELGAPDMANASPTQPPGYRGQNGANRTMAAPAVNRTMGGTLTGSISGLIEEVPLPDLLQLFSTSRKSGVLVIMNDDVGKIYLREGRVYFATINDDYELDPYKAFYRLIAWREGTFSLEQPSDETFDNEIDESIESLMMEGMRILDEIMNLGPETPDLKAAIQVPRPLVAALRDLNPEQLDTFQAALNFQTVSDLLNKSVGNDVDTMKNLVHLIRNEYLIAE